MVENYFLSLWINSNHLAEFPDSSLAWSSGELPQDKLGYMQDWDFWCDDNARSMALYHIVDETSVTQNSPVYPKDLLNIDPACATSEATLRVTLI